MLKNLHARVFHVFFVSIFLLAIFVFGVFWAKLGQDFASVQLRDDFNECHPGCVFDHQKTKFSFLKAWISKSKASLSSILGPDFHQLPGFLGLQKTPLNRCIKTSISYNFCCFGGIRIFTKKNSLTDRKSLGVSVRRFLIG